MIILLLDVHLCSVSFFVEIHVINIVLKKEKKTWVKITFR